MLVLARVRPLNRLEEEDEDGAGEVVVYTKDGGDDSQTGDMFSQCIIGVNLEGAVVSHKNEKEYRLDGVFGPDASQEDLFLATVPLLRAALSGYNTTVFTYGQTGTGKTHTMLGHDLWALAGEVTGGISDDITGDKGTRGIIPRALQYVFKQIRIMESANTPSWLRRNSKEGGGKNFMSSAKKKPKDGGDGGARVTVSVSYTEIYNEKVMDLLRVKDNNNDKSSTTNMYSVPNVQGIGAANMNSPSRQKKGGLNFGKLEKEDPGLDIREDKKLGILVPGLTEVTVESEEEVFQVLWKGAQNRAMASTNMNERSSRSHTILGVRLVVSNNGLVRRSKINLVDLAGSERYKTHQMAQFSEQRIKELTSINQSLSTLGNCISALTGKGKSHVPYRNSKLTRLLQDSIGGNCRTMFIVTVSPSAASCEETVSTLQFADRAMKVRVFATSNERLSTNDPLKQAQHEISRLKALLAAAVKRNSNATISKGQGGGKVSMQMVEKVDAGAIAEAEALRDENLKMAEEISRLREALAREKGEKTKLLEAVYSSSEGGKLGDLENLSTNHTAQLRVLDAQRLMLNQRQEEIEEAENDQEERREWLDSYHTWLRNLPVGNGAEGEGTGVVSEGGEGGGGVNPTLYDRLCMMETSVLLQSQELKRTKRLFLRDKERLEIQLAQSLEEVDGRDKIIKERDEDNDARLNALKNVEEKLQGEIATLRRKVSEQHAMIERVKEKMAKQNSAGSEVERRSAGSDAVAQQLERTSTGSKASRNSAQSTSRRGTTMALLSSENSRRDAKSVGVSRDELEKGANDAYMEAVDRLRTFSYEHGVNFDGATGWKEEEGEVEEVGKLEEVRGRARSSSVPEIAQVQKVWTEHFDANHGVPYYHNRITNETTWEPPRGWEEAVV